MSDKPEKAIDALHAELTDSQRTMGDMLQKSIDSDGANAPPMPDDLLDDVLSDLGVEKRAAASPTVEKTGVVESLFGFLRGKPFAFAGLAAAACIVAIIAVNMGDENGPGGVRGGGGQVVEPPIVVFADPTPEQKAAAQENFESEHLRFPALGEAVVTERARIVVDEGKIQAFKPGEERAFLEVDAPSDPMELIDTISVLTQAFDTEE